MDKFLFQLHGITQNFMCKVLTIRNNIDVICMGIDYLRMLLSYFSTFSFKLRSGIFLHGIAQKLTWKIFSVTSYNLLVCVHVAQLGYCYVIFVKFNVHDTCYVNFH